MRIGPPGRRDCHIDGPLFGIPSPGPNAEATQREVSGILAFAEVVVVVVALVAAASAVTVVPGAATAQPAASIGSVTTTSGNINRENSCFGIPILFVHTKKYGSCAWESK